MGKVQSIFLYIILVLLVLGAVGFLLKAFVFKNYDLNYIAEISKIAPKRVTKGTEALKLTETNEKEFINELKRLAVHQDELAGQKVIEYFNTSSNVVKLAVIEAAGYYRTDNHEEILWKALGGGVKEEVRAALKALGFQFSAKRVASLLYFIKNNGNSSAVATALTSLLQIAKKEKDQLFAIEKMLNLAYSGEPGSVNVAMDLLLYAPKNEDVVAFARERVIDGGPSSLVAQSVGYLLTVDEAWVMSRLLSLAENKGQEIGQTVFDIVRKKCPENWREVLSKLEVSAYKNLNLIKKVKDFLAQTTCSATL